jgi:hypothetical protein
MLNLNKHKLYRRDPMQFFHDLQKGYILDPSQIDWLQRITPTLLALAAGKRAKVRRFWLECSKGWAKTGLTTMAIAWLIVFAPRALLIVVLARDQQQGLEFVKASKELLPENRMIAPQFEVQRDKVLNPKTETVAEVWTADDLGRHGGRPNVTWIDEISHIDDFEVVCTALDNQVKVASGVAILSGNAGFSDSPTFALREQYRTGGPSYSFFQFNKPAPWLSEEDLYEAEQRNSTSRFRRLFWGVWSNREGNPIAAEDIAASITMEGPLSPDEERWKVVAVGLDLGVKNDHSACVGLAVKQGSARIRLAFCESWKPKHRGAEVDLRKVRQFIIDKHRLHNFGCLYFDPSQALLMAQDCRRVGVPVLEMTFTGRNLNLMAETMLTVFKTRVIDLYRDKDLCADLARISIEERPWGHRLSAPSDESGHCDRATALAIALPWAVQAAHRAAYTALPISTGHARVNSSRWGVHLSVNPRSPRSGVFLDRSGGSGWKQM